MTTDPTPASATTAGATGTALTDQRYAELTFRRFARQTNQLVAGRAHAVVGTSGRADAVARTLAAMGAAVYRYGTEAEARQQPGAHLHLTDASTDTEPGTAPRAAAGAAGRVAPDTDTTASPTRHAPATDYLGGQPRRTAAERVAWARDRMPIVEQLSRTITAGDAVADLRIGICLVLEPKTAVLAIALAEAGANVSLYGHPEETDTEVADELRRRGITVYADADATPEQAIALMDAFLSEQYHLLIDDGGRVIRRAHHVPGALDSLIGAAEETTSGLRNLAKEPGGMRIPVIAVNNAKSKTWFDNAIGTGQSCVSTILDLLDPREDGWSIVDARVAIAGYGPVGRGVARHVTALGGRVTIVDIDPRAALRAATDGYPVAASLVEAAASADLVVSATGYAATVTPEVLRAAAPGTAFAVAGGVDDEIQSTTAIAAGARWEPVSQDVEHLVYPDGHRVTVLDRGGCINCTAGEGNPIEIMDLSFGVQLSALDTLLREGATLGAGIHPIDDDADQLVSAIGLAALTATHGSTGRPEARRAQPTRRTEK